MTFPLKLTQVRGIKILTSKQMLQTSPIFLALIQVRNTSENLLNEILQIKYSLHWTKEITNKVYSNYNKKYNFNEFNESIIIIQNRYHIYEFWK